MKDFDKNPPSKKKKDPREIEEKSENPKNKKKQAADEFDIACDMLLRDIDKNANKENETEIEIKEKKIEKKKDKKIEVLKKKEKGANENSDDSEGSEDSESEDDKDEDSSSNEDDECKNNDVRHIYLKNGEECPIVFPRLLNVVCLFDRADNIFKNYPVPEKTLKKFFKPIPKIVFDTQKYAYEQQSLEELIDSIFTSLTNNASDNAYQNAIVLFFLIEQCFRYRDYSIEARGKLLQILKDANFRFSDEWYDKKLRCDYYVMSSVPNIDIFKDKQKRPAYIFIKQELYYFNGVSIEKIEITADKLKEFEELKQKLGITAQTEQNNAQELKEGTLLQGIKKLSPQKKPDDKVVQCLHFFVEFIYSIYVCVKSQDGKKDQNGEKLNEKEVKKAEEFLRKNSKNITVQKRVEPCTKGYSCYNNVLQQLKEYFFQVKGERSKQNVEYNANNHYCDDEEIKLLLGHYANLSTIKICCFDPIHYANFNPITFFDCLRKAVQQNNSDSLFIPVDLKNSHWVALNIFLSKNKNVVSAIFYFDPYSEEEILPPDEILNVLKYFFQNTELKINKITLDSVENKQDCWSRIIDVLRNISTGSYMYTSFNSLNASYSEYLKILEESWNLKNIIQCLPSKVLPRSSPKPKTTPNKRKKRIVSLKVLMDQISFHEKQADSFNQYGCYSKKELENFRLTFRGSISKFAQESTVGDIIRGILYNIIYNTKNKMTIDFLFFHIIGEMLHRKKIREQYYADEYLLSKLTKQISSPSAIGGKNENDENKIIEREVAEEKPQDLLTAFIDVCKFTFFAKYNEYAGENKIADESYKKNFTEALIDFGSLLKKLIEQGTITTANLSEEQKKSIHLIINDASKWAEDFILLSYNQKSEFLLRFFTKVLSPACTSNGGYKYLTPVVTQESHETNVTTIGTGGSGSLTNLLLGKSGDYNGTALTINQSCPNPTGSYSGMVYSVINSPSTNLESPSVTANSSLYLPVSPLVPKIVDLNSPPPVPISSGSDTIQNTMRPSTPPEEKDKKKTPPKRKRKQEKKNIEEKNVKKRKKNSLQENKKNKSNNNSKIKNSSNGTFSTSSEHKAPKSQTSTDKEMGKNGSLTLIVFMKQFTTYKNRLSSFKQYGYKDSRQVGSFAKAFKNQVLAFAKKENLGDIIQQRLSDVKNSSVRYRIMPFLFFHIIGEMLHRKKIREQYYADKYLLSKLIKQISSPSATGAKNENDENKIIEREVAEEKPQDLLTAFIDVCKFTAFTKYNERAGKKNKIADESYKKNFTEALIDFGSLLKKLIEQGTITTANLSEEQKKSINLIINDPSKWAESFILHSDEKSEFLLEFFTNVLSPAHKLKGSYKYLTPVVTQESHETNVTTIGTGGSGSLTNLLLGNCGDYNGTALTINQSCPNPTGSYSGMVYSVINSPSTHLESPPVTANPNLYLPVSPLVPKIVDLNSPLPVPTSSDSDAIQNTIGLSDKKTQETLLQPSTPPEEKDKKKTPPKRKRKQEKKNIEEKNVKKRKKNSLQENKKNKSNNNSETESKNAPSISKNNMFRQPPSSLLTGNVLTTENKSEPLTTFQFFNDPNLSDELNNPNNINNKGNANNLNINKI